MDRQKVKLVLTFIIGLLSAFLIMYMIKDNKIKNEAEKVNKSEVSSTQNKKSDHSSEINSTEFEKSSGTIDELTEENRVVNYVKTNHQLPDYYLTKSEARKRGWVASKGNLCEVLPGKAIGGDHFSDREKTLPKGNKYYEADVNYNCGNRNADRIVFTKNGEVWLTKNHYKSFEKQ